MAAFSPDAATFTLVLTVTFTEWKTIAPTARAALPNLNHPAPP
jgi:hypothetical protein